MDNNFAYRPPQQANAYGPDAGPSSAEMAAQPGIYATDKNVQDDMPSQVDRAQGGKLSSAQMNRYMAARQAMIGAQENMNETRGMPREFSKPEDATNYPAW